MSRATLRGATVSVVLLLVHVTSTAVAATPEWTLRDYVQTTWTHRDGISLARPIAITQTADGYLWFIVEGYLVRFDGVRFVPVPMPAPCDRLETLARGDGGDLWITCRDPKVRLFRRRTSGRITEIALTGLEFKSPPDLFVDKRERVWLFGTANRLVRLEKDGVFREIAGDDGVGVSSLVEDVAGALWGAARRRVFRIVDDRLEYTRFDGVRGLHAAPSGGLFACGKTEEIRHLEGTSEIVVARGPQHVGFMETPSCMGVDAAGGLWIATLQHGIALVQGDRLETSLSRNEPGGTVTGVFVDREDNIWIGSYAGLHRFRRPHARLLSIAVTEVPPRPTAVFVDSPGNIWIIGDHVARLNTSSGLNQGFEGWTDSRAFGEDEAGRLWLARAAEIGRIEGSTFRPVRDVDGASVSNVWAFANDRSGHLWAVAKGVGIYQVTPGPPRLIVAEPATMTDFMVSSRQGVWMAVAGGGVKQFLTGSKPTFHDVGPEHFLSFLDDDDVIWLGSFRGLLRWRGGRWTKWTSAHGLPSSGAVHEITRDRAGRLWLMTAGGIVVLSRADLEATPDGAPGPLRFVQIGSLDRVVPHRGPPSNSPRISVDRDGRMYFATIDSVAVVDPATMTPSSLRPTIVIESVAADNQPVDTAAAGRLVAPSRLQFGYTSLSLRNPENIRFRYRLENYDADWIEAGTARQVTYGTLRPGSYRFRVVGSGSEGVWNEEGTTYAFQIVPRFYATWWFRGLALATVAAVIGAAYHLRVSRLTKTMHIRFEERLAERTRIARDLHDGLLQGTLAAAMHARLSDDALAEMPPSAALVEARAPLQRAIQLMAQVADEGRATVGGLRTPVTLTDLAGALHRVATEQPNQEEIDFRVIVDGTVRQLRPDVADEIAWVAREAILNAYKHSRARQIEAELIYTRTRFKCIVRDDGQGIDQRVLERGRDDHWGLTGMRERAERVGGELHVRSGATAGTEVELSVKARVAYGDPSVAH